jgi:universal stress protein A
MSEYRHILLAVDLSPDADAIGQRAADLARRLGAELSLLHVVEQVPVDPANDVMVPERVLLDNQLVESAREALDALARRLGMTDSPRLVELGVTKNEIIRIAREQGTDLIVVGSHERHGLSLLLGSTANAVLHHAPCDVLAVRLRRA